MEKELLFLRVKGIKHSFGDDLTIYPSMEDLVEWVRESYARDCYWIKESDFYDGVDNEEPTLEEEQTEEGQKKYWNHHLAQLISLKQEGKLLDEAINYSIGKPNEKLVPILVIEILGKDMFINADNLNKDDLDSLELENVTNEFIGKLYDAIDTEEIETFVNTHTIDEIEEKYKTNFHRLHGDFSSMWEL